jgi:hypothetical protein
MNYVRHVRIPFTSSKTPPSEIIPEPVPCGGCRRTIQPVVTDAAWVRDDGRHYTIFDDLHDVVEEICSKTLKTVFEFSYPCLCDLKPPYRHWVVAVFKKEGAGWQKQDLPLERALRGGGGHARQDDGSPLPEPKRCGCGRMVKAQVVERWTARSFREALEGPGSHLPFDKPYTTPLKMLVYRHVCVCEHRPPYTAIERVLFKQTPGWS